MKITVITKGGFLHGKMRFKEGETYQVPPSVGGYFTGVGWAVEAEKDAKATEVDTDKFQIHAPRRHVKGDTLEVQDVEVKTTSPKAGKKEK